MTSLPVDLTSLDAAARPVVVWLAAGSAKAALLTLAVALAAAAAARASASTRHLLWLCAVSGALALPALSLAVPSFEVPLPRVASPDGASAPRGGLSAATPVAVAADAAPAAAEPRPVPALDGRPTGWAALALVVWAAGAFVVLGRFARAFRHAARLAGAARPLREQAWLDAAHAVGTRIGVRRPVALLVSETVSVPFVWGLRAPAMLLPADCVRWTAERRDVVLAHELAHVRRHDCVTQALANAACALHWFNPLVWLAARRLLVEREHAADDSVLRLGARASDYAEHLVALARCAGNRTAWRPSVAALTEPCELEGRIRSILDATRARRAPGRVVALATAVVAAALLVPLAATRPAAARHADRDVHDRERPPAATSSPADIAPRGAASAPARVQDASRSADARPSIAPMPTPTPTPSPDQHPSGDAIETSGDGPEPSVDTAASPDDAEMVRALEEATNDPDPGVRDQARWALQMIRIGRGDLRDVLPDRTRVQPDVRPIPAPDPRPAPAPRPAPTDDRVH